VTLLFLLPPSETKRDGGVIGSALDLAALSGSGVGTVRDARLETLAALELLVSGGDAQAARALALGPKIAAAELLRDRSVGSSPVMAAIERYTGVLYDALAAPRLSLLARERAARHVRIHSALFGLVAADDPLPAYRLSHSSRLPGASLKARWAPVVGALLAEHEGPIIDLRSEGYAALGPLPNRPDALVVRVVSDGADGAVRSLTHANKRSKGLLVRALLEQGELPTTVDDLMDVAGTAGWLLRTRGPGEAHLVVPAA